MVPATQVPNRVEEKPSLQRRQTYPSVVHELQSATLQVWVEARTNSARTVNKRTLLAFDIIVNVIFQ